MSGNGRAFLTVDGPDGWAIWITDGDPGPVDPQMDPMTAPLPAGVSHLLAANDALIPGRCGAHPTLCGQQVRRPNVEHDDFLDYLCFYYCPECVREATRWSAETVQPDHASELR